MAGELGGAAAGVGKVGWCRGGRRYKVVLGRFDCLLEAMEVRASVAARYGIEVAVVADGGHDLPAAAKERAYSRVR
ncbi:hypothetical protein [Ammonifex thiophilus]|uniref:hypothetical protein n=1 Tax=Ammonifex thiophilus TaxID=444093 RepID=UPI001402598A|nr:hypothetical protein [Ammonifex thiophilus]